MILVLLHLIIQTYCGYFKICNNVISYRYVYIHIYIYIHKIMYIYIYACTFVYIHMYRVVESKSSLDISLSRAVKLKQQHWRFIFVALVTLPAWEGCVGSVALPINYHGIMMFHVNWLSSLVYPVYNHVKSDPHIYMYMYNIYIYTYTYTYT